MHRIKKYSLDGFFQTSGNSASKQRPVMKLQITMKQKMEN